MVKGVAALHRRFEAIPDRIKDAVVEPMEAYAEQIVAMMRSLVPVKSGALRDSIGWTWGDDAPKGSLRIAQVSGRDFGGISITIYAGTRDKSLGDADAYYAMWQEFGTRNMPANPYFYVSWRANRGRVKAGITRVVRKAIKES